jgi:hypothetical protein
VDTRPLGIALLVLVVVVSSSSTVIARWLRRPQRPSLREYRLRSIALAVPSVVAGILVARPGATPFDGGLLVTILGCLALIWFTSAWSYRVGPELDTGLSDDSKPRFRLAKWRQVVLLCTALAMWVEIIGQAYGVAGLSGSDSSLTVDALFVVIIYAAAWPLVRRIWRARQDKPSA